MGSHVVGEAMLRVIEPAGVERAIKTRRTRAMRLPPKQKCGNNGAKEKGNRDELIAFAL